MKQKYIYCIDESFDGWLNVIAQEINDKDKDGLYYCTFAPSYEDGVSVSVENLYLFKDENIKWWRTPEDAKKALNIKLRNLYLEKKLPCRQHDYEEDPDTFETQGISESDCF